MTSFDRYKKTSFRKTRLERLIFEAIVELFVGQRIKDHVLCERSITITSVRCSPDLRLAKVFFSQLGLGRINEPEMRGILKAFRRATPFFDVQLRKRLDLYRIPKLEFVFDESLHDGERVWQLIDEVSRSSHE